MPVHGYTTAEIVRLGREIYERGIRAKVEHEHDGEFVVVDIVTGEYEVDADDVAASDRALARNPEAVLYSLRVGRAAAYRIGSGSRPTTR